MALNDLKLPSYLELQQQGHTNVGQADVPRLSAEDMQRLLDYVPCEVLLPAYNNLLDALQDATAGNDIGVSVEGLEASNVAEAMARLLAVVRNAQFAAGQMPAGGDVGQVLTKAGAGDYVTEWRNAEGGMSPAVYDPRGIAADAFDAKNATFDDPLGYYAAKDVAGALAEAGAKLTAAMLKSGGTFTGAVTLSGAPTANLHPATKEYADNLVAYTTGTGTLNTTYWSDGTIKWYKVGRLVMVDIKTLTPIESAINKSYTSYNAATGLPKAVATFQGSSILADGVSFCPALFRVNTSGTLICSIREILPSSVGGTQTFTGTFCYVSAS